MGDILRSCGKCKKPKRTEMSKNTCHKENMPANLDPSKAWIKNVGAGTRRGLSKKNRDMNSVLITTSTHNEVPNANMTTPRRLSVKSEFSSVPTPESAKPKNVVDCTVSAVPSEMTIATPQAFDVTEKERTSLYDTCFGIDASAIDPKETKPIELVSNLLDTSTEKSHDDQELEQSILENASSGYETIKDMRSYFKRELIPRGVSGSKGDSIISISSNDSDQSINNTRLPLNSTEILNSNTFARIDRVTNDLRNVRLSNGKLNLCYTHDSFNEHLIFEFYVLIITQTQNPSESIV